MTRLERMDTVATPKQHEAVERAVKQLLAVAGHPVPPVDEPGGFARVLLNAITEEVLVRLHPAVMEILPGNELVRQALRCPLCKHVSQVGEEAVYVVDVAERWSPFEWDGQNITGSYDHDDGDYEGAGYRCTSCSRKVELPDSVSEEGTP